MPTTSADYDIDTRRNYRQEGGQNSPYGKVSYRVLTNSGSGHGWYQNGKSGEDHQLVATGRSVEAVGQNIQKSKTGAQDPVLPAKWIQAKHGDVILEALDGDIILKGDNVIIAATGIRDTNDGDIQMYANKAVNIEGSDIRLNGAQIRITAKKDLTLVGKVYGELISGTVTMTSAADFGGSSIINKIKSVLNSFGAI